MRLTPPESLVPGVQESGDRLVFEVRSRSGTIPRRVDFEKKHGLGQCDCPDYRLNKNLNCHHIQTARAFLTVKVAQAIIRGYKKL